MKNHALLRITSLVAIVLMTLHVSDDIVRGLSAPGAANIFGVVIFVVWLSGILVLGERRSGHIIMLLGGLFAAAMPVLHMRGASYVAIVKSSGGLFFVWTLFAVGVTGTLAMILAVRALWSERSAKAR
jgi:hypothetical protein